MSQGSARRRDARVQGRPRADPRRDRRRRARPRHLDRHARRQLRRPDLAGRLRAPHRPHRPRRAAPAARSRSSSRARSASCEAIEKHIGTAIGPWSAGAKVAPAAVTERPRRHDKPKLKRSDDGPWRKLLVSAGRAEGLEPADLVHAVTSAAGVDGEAIRDVRVLERFSFLAVPEGELETRARARQRRARRRRRPARGGRRIVTVVLCRPPAGMGSSSDDDRRGRADGREP